jgi:hypothetical protein
VPISKWDALVSVETINSVNLINYAASADARFIRAIEGEHSQSTIKADESCMLNEHEIIPELEIEGVI